MKLFEKKPNVKEQVRASQRDIGRGVRDLDRELLVLKREEAKIVKEIKDAAKVGNKAGMKIHALSLVRLRKQQTKLQASQAQLRGVRTSITTAAATTVVGSSMQTATQAMQKIGQAANPQKLQQDMMQFQRENAKMDTVGEMMDDMMEDGENDEEADDVVSQVLDEIGVDITSAAPAAPQKRKTPVAAPASTSRAEEAEDKEADELLARLVNLK